MKIHVMVLMILLCIVSCTHPSNETGDYLKIDSLALAPPRLKASSTIIDSFITISATFKMKDAVIQYNKDSHHPDIEDIAYHQPLKITQPGNYNFKVSHKDWKPSKIASIKVYDKGHEVASLKWKTVANEKYPGTTDNELINNKKASINYTDIEWTGFDTTAIARATFKEPIYIEKLYIGYLIDTKSWIFPPEKVTVYFSEVDSVNVAVPMITDHKNQLADVEIPINRTVNQIDIQVDHLREIPDWHPGKGLKAWLFMDEWIFN